MDERAEKLRRQLQLAEKTLLALETYLTQARQVITNTRAVLNEAESGGGPPGEAGRPVE